MDKWIHAFLNDIIPNGYTLYIKKKRNKIKPNENSHGVKMIKEIKHERKGRLHGMEREKTQATT